MAGGFEDRLVRTKDKVQQVSFSYKSILFRWFVGLS